MAQRRSDFTTSYGQRRHDAVDRVARLLGLVHGLLAVREDWHGELRPLNGPCRLAVVDGALVPTDEPGSDEENVAMLSALDDVVLRALIAPYGGDWINNEHEQEQQLWPRSLFVPMPAPR